MSAEATQTRLEVLLTPCMYRHTVVSAIGGITRRQTDRGHEGHRLRAQCPEPLGPTREKVRVRPHIFDPRVDSIQQTTYVISSPPLATSARARPQLNSPPARTIRAIAVSSRPTVHSSTAHLNADSLPAVVGTTRSHDQHATPQSLRTTTESSPFRRREHPHRRPEICQLSPPPLRLSASSHHT